MKKYIIYSTGAKSYYKGIGEGLTTDIKMAYQHTLKEIDLYVNKENPLKYILVEKIKHKFGYKLKYTSMGMDFDKIDTEVDAEFKNITDSIASLLEYKNEKYGDAVLSPLDIFKGKCKAGQRLDDKLSRIMNSDELRKNDVADAIGYLILTCKEFGWVNFDEFKD